MFIVTDADVEFLAPLGAAYNLSAGTFHPWGWQHRELATIDILPLRGSGNSQDTSSGEESRAVSGSSPAFNHTRSA